MAVGSTDRMTSRCVELATYPPSSAVCLEIRGCNRPVRGLLSSERYTVRSKSSRTDFFLNRRHVPFFIQDKPHWHIHRLLRGRAVSENLPKIPLWGPSLILQLRLLGSQQHPQSGVLLTSFSTWGPQNSLAEINLESTRGDKGL